MLSTCKDRAKGCFELAELGMCVSTPVHMLEACRLSCGLCTTTCRDTLPGCLEELIEGLILPNARTETYARRAAPWCAAAACLKFGE